MNSKHNLTKEILNNLSEGHQYFDFPEFLQALRKAHSLSRRAVCKDLSFSEMRMFWLESGFFKHEMPKQELEKIATYYGVDSSLLLDKHNAYFEAEKAKAQSEYKPKRKKRKKNEN